jgi:membrane protein YdbS with pleckstrin-like domain
MFINETVFSLPDISEITFKSISKKYLKVILWNIIIVFAVILLALFLTDYFNLFKEKAEYFYFTYIVFIVILLFVIAIKFVGFKRRKYALREKDISYKSGVLFKKLTTVPFSRVQHIEVDEGPISRLFNLASLSIYTAGDSSDDLEIKGITKKEALEIKEFISLKINE